MDIPELFLQQGAICCTAHKKNMASRENQGCEAPWLHCAWDSPAAYTSCTRQKHINTHHARHLLHPNHVIPGRNAVSSPLKTFSTAKPTVSRCVFHLPSWNGCPSTLLAYPIYQWHWSTVYRSQQKHKTGGSFSWKSLDSFLREIYIFLLCQIQTAVKGFVSILPIKVEYYSFAETAFSIKDIFNWLFLINLILKAVFNITCQ